MKTLTPVPTTAVLAQAAEALLQEIINTPAAPKAHAASTGIAYQKMYSDLEEMASGIHLSLGELQMLSLDDPAVRVADKAHALEQQFQATRTGPWE